VTIYLERDDIVAGGGIACGFSLMVADEGLLRNSIVSLGRYPSAHGRWLPWSGPMLHMRCRINPA
jgi:hypothetical protein